jgi:hypothetical protein
MLYFLYKRQYVPSFVNTWVPPSGVGARYLRVSLIVDTQNGREPLSVNMGILLFVLIKASISSWILVCRSGLEHKMANAQAKTVSIVS